MNLFIILLSITGLTQLYGNIIIEIQPDEQKCEQITVPMCSEIEYNMTSLPNQFGHETQQEATAEVNQYWALVQMKCAPELRFFLCSMYTPICVKDYPRPIKACKSVCERVKVGCEKLLKQYGFEWPEQFDCELFPEYGSQKEVCMDPIDAVQQKQKINVNNDYNNKEIKQKITTNKTRYECFSPLIRINDQNDFRFGKVSTNNIKNCAQPCRSIYFDENQLEFSYYWILVIAILCFLSSSCTTITYLIEIYRFKYPEKPIIYLSVCYLFISLGYLVRYLVGNESTSCEIDGSIKYPFSTINLSCTITFILNYYFTMASATWWVIISLTWFLAAGLKWSIESIAAYNSYFHLIAWFLPGIKTVTILALGLVDGDALSGICYVGNLDLTSLKIFLIIPMIIYLTIGISFLSLGFVSLIRLRKLIRHQQQTDKLEKLMLRIGVFSILYTLPQTCVIVCLFYENYYRSKWEESLIKGGLNPEFAVFMLKYFMSLIIGITSGFWVWTWKSIASWKLFLTSIFTHKQEKIFQYQPAKVDANLYQFPPLQSDYCNLASVNGNFNKAANFNASSKYSIPSSK